jgi:hypothetical protein
MSMVIKPHMTALLPLLLMMTMKMTRRDMKSLNR